jgi:hypothetical protein
MNASTGYNFFVHSGGVGDCRLAVSPNIGLAWLYVHAGRRTAYNDPDEDWFTTGFYIAGSEQRGKDKACKTAHTEGWYQDTLGMVNRI